MSIVRLGRFIPKTLRDWDIVFRDLNKAIQQTADGGVTITADNLPAADAAFVTLSNNASLSGDRVLTPAPGQLTVVDGGAGSTVTVGLADFGIPGTYAKVTTDEKGRVLAGAGLTTADMPAALQRIYSGAGSPNGVVTAPQGSLYLRTSGGAGTTLYVKESGVGSSGWVAK